MRKAGPDRIINMLKSSAILVCGLGLLAAAPAGAQVQKPFPHHWGQPPDPLGGDLGVYPASVRDAVKTNFLSQSTNLVPLPGDYGRGKPALARWIARNLERDQSGAVPAARLLYGCDFEAAILDKAPEDFLVLDGGFAVKAESGNRALELPGTPLDSYGVLFGPVVSNNVAVSARVFGTNKGRRLPVFGVGLFGAGGLKLMAAPGKGLLEILRGDESIARAAYRWEPGKWVSMRLQVRALEDGAWQAEGKAWSEGAPEPVAWLVTHREKSDLSPGRAALWGSPISSTPILYDDLQVMTVGK